MKKIKIENRFEEDFFKIFPQIARRSARKGYHGVIVLKDEQLLEYDPHSGKYVLPSKQMDTVQAMQTGYFPLHSVKALVRFARKHDYLPAGSCFIMFCADDSSLRNVQTWAATLTD